MRVICRLSEAHRELKAYLLQFPQRDRPERLRIVATIGILAIQNGQIGGGGAITTNSDQHPTSDSERKRAEAAALVVAGVMDF